MGKLGLNDALRYLFAGATIFVYMQLTYPKAGIWLSEVFSLPEALNALMLPVLFILLGTLIYGVYRPVIYSGILIRLQDRLADENQNYRTYLKSLYPGLETYMAHQIWGVAKFTYHKEDNISFREHASLIHLLYMSGTSALPFALGNMILGQWVLFAGLLFTGVVLLYSGFMMDREFGRFDLQMLKQVDEADLDAVVQRFTGDPAFKRLGASTAP